MKIRISQGFQTFEADLSQPIDLSLPLRRGTANPTAWYCGPVVIEPVVNESFIGDVNRGGSVNFRDITFNPHGHGTHTECVGHISRENFTINESLRTFFFMASLVSIRPETLENGDEIISLAQLSAALPDAQDLQAVIIRTLPNGEEKKTKNYSNTNPPYIAHDAAAFLANRRISHLLTDLPSVDRELDEGKLLAHHAFWNYPGTPRTDATITELIFVPDEAPDGIYLLNLQIAAFENDASPSKPVLYALNPVA